jgi:hypothetical protein
MDLDKTCEIFRITRMQDVDAFRLRVAIPLQASGFLPKDATFPFAEDSLCHHRNFQLDFASARRAKSQSKSDSRFR